MDIYGHYRARLTASNDHILIVGHMRVISVHPEPRVHVPLFDELTPALAADSPYPLYALATITVGAHRDQTWCLVPVYIDPGSPRCVRVQAANTPLSADRAEINETVYAALHAPEDENVPALVRLHARDHSTSTREAWRGLRDSCAMSHRPPLVTSE
ncbi:hypothetical protein IU450_36115 [Nocardia abscessus]|uniref:hypothetical protein n=1 Tax=Nocardia abscessus TaxID=120957 RepID=UPI001894FB8A|nr:hypothetical protein [Nocardia abscessus]MBF6341268.1 hypothetical protein [Nocardia abscessus]